MRHIRRLILLLLWAVLLPACSQSKSFTPQEEAYVRELGSRFNEIANLSVMFCLNVYPQPTPTECIDRIKHGIGASADPHSEYMNEKEFNEFREQTSGRFVGIGAEVARPNKFGPILIVSPIEGSPSARAGIQPGDAITHIWKDATTIVPTSALKSLDAGVKMLRGDAGTSVKIRVLRMGVTSPLEFTIVRDDIKRVVVKGETLSSNGNTYAFIKVLQFQDDVAALVEKKIEEFDKKNQPLNGVILSLEDNPGGLLPEAYNMIRLFDDSAGDIVLIRNNEGIHSYIPGKGSEPGRVLHETPRNIARGLPILILVNGGSASASEVVAKALQHKGLVVVASSDEFTFMKGIVQTARQIGPTEIIKYTSSEYLIGSMRDWVPVQCIGVIPDIRFEYTGIKSPPRLSECVLSEHLNTAGTMPNAPTHLPIKEANPALYQAGAQMLEAYKQYRLPQLQAEEQKRKDLEELLKVK